MESLLMSEAYKKLIKTLQNIFEMDKADLDFGIYRIMNQKRDEINKFLNEDLLPQVKKAFEDFANKSNKQAHDELKNLTKTLEDAGMDPDSSPKVLELKKQISNSVDITALENDVFSKLHTFFSRYYDKGDFISQRRYKPNTYAIPYEGEEVKLYWANHDQYYIKSSEHLRDYAFIAKDGQDNDQPFRIKLVEADTEKDNIKEKADEERRFVLNEAQPLSIENGELIIHFNFISVGKKDQKKLNEDAVKTIFNQTDKEFNEWLNILKKPDPTEKNKDRTLLEKHIHAYTALNTFDYFIHKNLGDFLRRELDFFIKNEVLHLDDIDDNSFELTEQQLRKIKILRTIAHKIIGMLAQIEDFQKKMWLKKKFVIETNYCITLESLPLNLIPAVMANENQKAEWVELYSINKAKLEKDYLDQEVSVFLKTPDYRYLVVDTKFFELNFKDNLLANINNIDESCDGLLIHADNFQALNFLDPKYSSHVQGIYIDPPYNTDASSIMYKNGYKDSSWLSLMKDRLIKAKSLMKHDGLICTAIDDQEVHFLRSLLEDIFSKRIGVAVVKSNPQSRKTTGKFSPVHEYALFYGKSEGSNPHTIGYSEAKSKRYPFEDNHGRFAWMNFIRAGNNDLRTDRPKLYYPIAVNSNDKIRIPKLEWNEQLNAYDIVDTIEENEELIFPIRIEGDKVIEKNWQRGHIRVSQDYNEYRVRRDSSGNVSIDFKTRMDVDAAPVTWWDKGEYASANYGASELKDLFGSKSFDFPKSKGLVYDCIRACGASICDGPILDFFAGSGTTAQAVLELSRDIDVRKKYILCEQGPYMHSLIIPRIKKVVYSDNWKNGKPFISEKKETNGNHHFFKYLILESYEDTLANLQMNQNSQINSLLEINEVLREDYMLGYFMDIETSKSTSLLNIEQFEDPFNYKLNISSSSAGATKPTTIDLIETFNYLIGLKVKTIDVIRDFKIITGTNPNDEMVLIVWRRVKEKDNTQLEEFLDKQGYNPRDTEFQHIYINGDHTLEDPHSKVKMIEIEFKRLMFDVKDI